MNNIYLDHAATTRTKEPVIEAMLDMLRDNYGNPSALHGLGMGAEKKIKEARQKVAKSIGADAGQIIFTGGGTEANNLALFGSVTRGKDFITTTIEHPSVLEVFKGLREQGKNVIYLDVNPAGYLAVEKLREALTDETGLVSIGFINNEIGTVQNMKILLEEIRAFSQDIMIHVDAVQAWGKLPFSVGEMPVDFLTLSAHKAGGPKGVGVLYVGKSQKLKPLIRGGGQERALRSGTENTPGIVGMGITAELLPAKRDIERMTKLKGKLYELIKRRIDGVQLNGPPVEEGAPHILNLSFPNVRAQVLVQALAEEGIYVSSGSACSSKEEDSHVLQALGYSKKRRQGAVRFSLGEENTLQEMETIAKVLATRWQHLQKVMRL